MSDETEDSGIDQALENRDQVVVKRHNVLPSPWASLVSLATATSSFTISVGGFFGHAALSAARIGTLSSLELGRAVLEGILTRAGRDVVNTSLTPTAADATSRLTDRTLALLHFSITQTSFLISSGFQIGSTSLESGLAVANGVLGTLHAVLGDTDTSKAVAAIVVLIQREYKTPEGANPKERLTLGDALVAVISIALLQRWCKETTDRDFREAGGEETVWDIVVVHDAKHPWKSLPLEDDDEDDMEDDSSPDVETSRPRPLSFVSATGDQTPFEGFPVDDGSSFVTMSSARPSSSRGNANTRVEEAFRQQLIGQIEPGSSVHVTSHSISTDVVTVEISGALAPYVDAPPGYTLVAFEGPNQARPEAHRFVFKRTRKRRREGNFDVLSVTPRGPSLEATTSSLSANASGARTPATAQVAEEPPKELQKQASNLESALKPVTANESRARKPSPHRFRPYSPSTGHEEGPNQIFEAQSRPERTNKMSIRKTLKNSASVKNLVDFWSRDKSPTQHGPGSRRARMTSGSQPWQQHAQMMQSRYEDEQREHEGNVAELTSWRELAAAQTGSLDENDLTPNTHRGHRKSASSIYSLRSETSTSLVRHSSRNDLSQEQIAAHLHRVGELPWTFPHRPLALNLSRYARFSLASYGATFLRFAGSSESNPPLARREGHSPAEHYSFSTYTGLPPSTVLLSSFVDPQGGTNASGETETGMPLVHYISLDQEAKAVVITIRGTLGYNDILADSQCDDDEIKWNGQFFRVHKGILASARRLITMHGSRLLATIKAALEEFEDYGLVLCGHSLGGAVASVLATLLALPTKHEHSETSTYFTNPNLTGETSGAVSLYSLPPRPIHAYAYGPAACVSPAFQRATRGLITTIINSKDVVPYLSLGALHNCQNVAIALKTDADDAKGELRRRAWRRFSSLVQDKTGFGAISSIFQQEFILDEAEDLWPLAALKSLRASMQDAQLVPPGEVFVVESSPVLAKHAFVEPQHSSNGKTTAKTAPDQSYRPATRIQVTHVRDVETKFHEIQFGASMFTDHLPGKYESILASLERGVCC